MKVLVRLNPGKERSYLLNFGNRAKKHTVHRMLKSDRKTAVKSLLGYAMIAGIERMEVDPFDMQKAHLEADLTINPQGYAIEKLD